MTKTPANSPVTPLIVDQASSGTEATTVTEAEIRSLVRHNWVFELHDHPRLRLFALFVLPALLIAIGALISAVLGEFMTFITNPLAYTGAIGLFVALSAYLWLAATLPKVLVAIFPAIGGNAELRKEAYLATIKKRAQLVNNRALLVTVGSGIGLLFLNLLITSWSPDGNRWLGTPWVESEHAVFFALYQGLFSVVGSAILLGTGLIGLFGTIWLVQGIFTQPLRLEYYRRISAVSDVSIGITFWALLALIAVVFSISVSPGTSQDTFSRILLSVLASGALVSILSLPILYARSAIIREKQIRIGYFEEFCHQLSAKILEAAAQNPSEIEMLKNNRALLISEIEEIEKIPEWPISTLRAIQLVSVSPLIGVLNFVLPLLEPQLQEIQRQVFNLFG